VNFIGKAKLAFAMAAMISNTNPAVVDSIFLPRRD
jgi:NhaP-type Na+/H+ or K+/H+ antiporter